MGREKTDVDLVEIGSRMKQAREALKLSQKDFHSKFCDGSVRTFQKNEAGLNEAGIGLAASFVRAGVNANWLLVKQGEMLLMNESQNAAPTPAQAQDVVEKNKNKIDIELLLLCISALSTHFGDEYKMRGIESQIEYARKLVNEVDQYDPTVDPRSVKNLSEEDLLNFIKFLVKVGKLPLSIQYDF